MDDKGYTLEDSGCKDRCVLLVSGRIDSSNAENFAEDLKSLLSDGRASDGLEMNLNGLTYISSTGLRILLGLRKQQGHQLRLVDVDDAVYNILEMTGFTNIFQVRRKLREFDVTPYKEMDRGATGVIYRIDDDTILKLYPPGKDISFAEDELRQSRLALVYGVPTAIPFEIVKNGDAYGVLFELVKADTAAKVIMAEKSDREVAEWGRRLGRLLKEIHSLSADTAQIRSVKELYISRLRMLTGYLTSEQIDDLISLVMKVPDVNTMLHGDFHVRNIMLQNGELLMIDMGDMGYGHPIFDLSMTFISSRYQPYRCPDVIGLSPERALIVWDQMLREYFGTEDETVLAAKNRMIRAFACPRMLLFPVIIPNSTDEFKQEWIDNGLRLLPDFREVVNEIGSFI